MGDIISLIVESVTSIFSSVIFPIAQYMIYFMAIVLVVTFIANISGIIGFFIFILMFYYYVKGIIFIDPAPKNSIGN
jgi:hypothetical protein